MSVGKWGERFSVFSAFLLENVCSRTHLQQRLDDDLVQQLCRWQANVSFQVLRARSRSLIALRERNRLRIVLSSWTDWRLTSTKKMRAFKTKFRQLNSRSLTLKLGYCLDSTALTLSFRIMTHRSQTRLLKQMRWSWVWFTTACFYNGGINR